MAVTSPRASSRSYRVVPPVFYRKITEDNLEQIVREIVEWQKQTVDIINGILLGKINTVGTFTLGASVASTTMTDSRVGAETSVILVPTTANASAEIGAGTIYQTYPNVTDNQAVINHANNAQTDRTFAYALLG
jgi:hypothetical protein